MLVHFHFKIILDEKFFFFETVVDFRFVLEGKHFEASEGLVDDICIVGVDYFKEVFFEEGLCCPLFDEDDVSDDEGVLLDFHPDVVAELAVPDEGGVLEKSVVELLVVMKVDDVGVLLTAVEVLLNPHSPVVDLLDEVDGHVPQAYHVCEDIADGPNGFFDRLVDVDDGVAFDFDPVHIGSILLGLSEVLLGEEGDKPAGLADVPSDFVNASLPGLDPIVHDLKEAPPLKQGLVLCLQPGLDDIQIQSLELAQQRV
jgi:hypothetical protein